MVYYKIASLIVGPIIGYIYKKIYSKKKDGVPPNYEEYRPPKVEHHKKVIEVKKKKFDILFENI